MYVARSCSYSKTTTYDLPSCVCLSARPLVAKIIILMSLPLSSHSRLLSLRLPKFQSRLSPLPRFTSFLLQSLQVALARQAKMARIWTCYVHVRRSLHASFSVTSFPPCTCTYYMYIGIRKLVFRLLTCLSCWSINSHLFLLPGRSDPVHTYLGDARRILFVDLADPRTFYSGYFNVDRAFSS